MAKFRAKKFWEFRNNKKNGNGYKKRNGNGNSFRMEPLEPRLLLSADLSYGAAGAFAEGLGLFGDKIHEVLQDDAVFDARIPLITQVDFQGDSAKNVAPSLGTLLSVPVDPDGDGPESPNTELQALDTDAEGTPGYGIVDTDEFLQGWFFDPLESLFDEIPDPSDRLTSFLHYELIDEGNFNQDMTVGGYHITFDVLYVDDFSVGLDDPETTGTTERVPAGEIAYQIGFQFMVEQDLALDLGTEADALKLLLFQNANLDAPVVPVTSEVDFGFTFGVNTGGQEPALPGEELDEYDFFIRTATPMTASVTATENANDNFFLNIGFLGTRVQNYDFDLYAEIDTTLIDPNDPDVLGFTDSQHGDRITPGVIVANEPIPSPDLDHPAGFFLRIGNLGIVTEVLVEDHDRTTLDDGNRTNSNDLLDDINAALQTAGLDALITASLTGAGNDILQFSLVSTTPSPFGFADENIGFSGELRTTPNSGNPSYPYEFASDVSFLLSVGGAVPELVTVVFPDTSQTELGFGEIQSAILPDLAGQNNASATIGGDGTATFNVRVTQSDGTVTGPVAVNVTQGLSSPDPNTTLTELNSDVVVALANAGLNSLILSKVVGNKIVLYAWDPSDEVSAIEITSADTETENSIGFVAGQRTTLIITAESTPIPSFDLTSDAHFKLTIVTTDGNRNVDVTVPADLNANVAALAEDINLAIDTALMTLGNKIDVDINASGKIVLKATDSTVLSFNIKTINTTIDDLVTDVNSALDQAGLTAITASTDGTDLILTESGGKTLEITKTLGFDAGVTYAELETNDAADLFVAEVDEAASNASFDFPVKVIAGLNYDPADVHILGNFSPFNSAVTEFDDGVDRYRIKFELNPTVEKQDTAPVPVPTITPDDESALLVNMAEPLNFNLITADSIIGLLKGLGTALQQIANSGLFATYDIPFADSALSELLNFTDSDKVRFSGLIDTELIYDTGGDGVYDKDDATSVDNDADRLLKWISINEDGDWVSYLVPTFRTAQDLATRLSTILDVLPVDINANYDPSGTLSGDPRDGINELTYEVELLSSDRASIGVLDQNPSTLEFDPFTAPFEYDVDLSPFAKMAVSAAAESTSTEVALQGRTGLKMTFGVNLSPPGAVIYEGTKLSDLNSSQGVDIKLEAAVTGTKDVRAGMLSKDAHFWVLIPGMYAPSDNAWVYVTVDSGLTTNNYTFAHLAQDINTAIGATDAAGWVTAAYDENYSRLKLETTNPNDTLYVYTYPSSEPANYDTAITEMGFAVGFSITGQTVYAESSGPVGRLTDDAVFNIAVDGGDPVSVTVEKIFTESNYGISDLVTDVNNALNEAGLGDTIVADYDRLGGTELRLVLSAVDAATEFTVTATGTAVSELGLPSSATADRTDFIIIDSNGSIYPIVLDDFIDPDMDPQLTGTVEELINYINTTVDSLDGTGSTLDTVVADINSSRTGLRLVDKTGAIAEQFQANTINGSPVLLQLGFIAAENETAQNETIERDRYRIEGSSIGFTNLDDRFFVRDAEIRLEAIKMQTPDGGIPGEALFGIVGLDTFLTGTMYAEATAGIKNPHTGAVGGQVTLAELFDGAIQGRLTNDASFKITIGSQSVNISVPKTVTSKNSSLDDLAQQVNDLIVTTGFADKIAAKADSARIAFVALDDPATFANEASTTSFSITADPGTAITEMGLSGTAMNSQEVDHVQTVVARAAARFAVAEPVVAKPKQLAFGNYLWGQFEVGTTVNGWIDIDNDNSPDTISGSAFILDVEPNLLTLRDVTGTFSGTLLLATDDLSVFAIATGDEVAQIENFGEFNLHIEVQDGFDDPQFVAGDSTHGFGLLDGLTSEVPFSLTEFGNPFDPVEPEADLDLSGIGDLAAFEHLSYSDLNDMLKELLALIENVQDRFELFNTKLPAINKSVGELLSLVDGFERSVDNADDALSAADFALDPEGIDLPAPRLQDMPALLRSAFGLPVNPISNPSSSNSTNWVRFDFDKDNNMLLLDFRLSETLNTKLGLDIDGLEGQDGPLPNLTSGGVLKVEGGLDINLQTGIDLDKPEDAYLFDTSSIDASLTVEGEGQKYAGGEDGMGLVFRAALGPLAVFIQDGDALIDVAFSLPGLEYFGNADTKLISQVKFDPEDVDGLNELGFEAEQTAEKMNGDPAVITATSDAQLVFEKDVAFTISINDGTPVWVAVAGGNYGNAAALIAAVNDGLAAAGLGGQITAGLSGEYVSLVAVGAAINKIAISTDIDDDFLDPVISKNDIEIVLPMFFGGEGPDDYIGDFKAIGPIENVVVTTPDFANIEAGIEAGDIEFDPFDNILLAIDTVNVFLEQVGDIVSGDILGTKLPFIGDQMADVLFIESFRNTLVRTLKSEVENAIDPDPDTFVKEVLEGLFGPEGQLNGYLLGEIEYVDNVGDEGVAIGDWYRQWNLTLHRGPKAYFFDDFDLGVPNLGFDLDGLVEVDLEWTFSFGFGVNFKEGAYIDVSSGNDESGVELDIDLKIDLPNSETGTLGYLRLDATDTDDNSGAKIDFDVDVKKGTTSDERLGFSDLGNINVDAFVEGGALSEGILAATLHLVTKAEKGLPSLITDFVFDWSLPADTDVENLAGDAVTPFIRTIELNSMFLDANSVAESLLGPILDNIREIIDPFMPVVDTLTYPIPILSDVAGEPFTLLDLAAIFGSVDPAFIDAVADILNLIKMVDAATDLPDLALGSLVLFDITDPNPANHIKNFDPMSETSDLADILVDSWDPENPNTSVTGWTFNQAEFEVDNEFLNALRSGEIADGLSMPVFTDARQALKLLLNQNAVMVDYLLPPLSVDFSYLQVFPIWGPLALSIEISFGFTVDMHSVGFDTYGYQRYARGGFRNTAAIFDGFYLNDLNEEGVDEPEVTFEFGLVGAAELNLGIARAGVEGGIDAIITFDWFDPIPDGRVHATEMYSSFISADYNPLAIFDVGGALTFQMALFLEISLLGIDLEFPITPEVTLFDFEIDFDRMPILATDLGSGVLQLNMGPNAEDRMIKNTSDGNEEFYLEYGGGNTVYVWSPKLGVSYSDKQEYTGVSHIVGLGGQGNDVIELQKFNTSTITAEFEGGVGDDRIEYKTNGIASSSAPGAVIYGGVGNDTLIGGHLNDEIYGGEGNDLIRGNGGYDILFGDTGRIMDVIPGDPLLSSRIRLGDGNDEIHGGAETDVLIGAGGDDKLYGDGGDDVMIGDGVLFEYLLTGDGHIDLTTVRPGDPPYPYHPEEVYTSNPTPPEQISKDIDEIYDAVVGVFRATNLGYGGNDLMEGGSENDMILGGTGNDILKGNGGADIILGDKGFDEIHGGAGDDTIFGGEQADTIYGEAGDDVISGGSGNDFIHGNTGDDVMKGDSGADVMFGDENNDQVFGQTEPDILFGGVGDDLVVGGTGIDIMFGDDGLVAKIDPDLTDGSDDSKVIGIGFGGIVPTGQFKDTDIRTVDLIITDVVAGDGDDVLSGESADDIMLGGGGNDLMGGDVDPRLPNGGENTSISEDVMIGDGGKLVFDLRRFKYIETIKTPIVGSEFDDVIYGDNGNDYIFGGWGSDFLFGGHGRVVDISLGVEGVGAFRGPTDEDASDSDIIFGDNGRIDFAPYSSGHPDNFGVLTKAYTTDDDVSEDTGADDYAEGELDNDIIFGGVNNDDGSGDEEVDRLFGHEGRDVVLGDNGIVEFDLDADVNLDTLDKVRSFLDHLGGTDEVSGSNDFDVLIGGTGGDRIYGDDESASHGSDDGKDIMLGDNGQVDLLDAVGLGSEGPGSDLFVFFGGAVVEVNTTDGDPDFGAIENDATTGGVDYMYGNYSDDLIAGSAWGDFLYGSEGDDLILGDAARYEWLYDGSEVTPFEKSQNSLLETFDTTFYTLDLVTTKQPNFGGRDYIDGMQGEDTAFGGTNSDIIHGGTQDDILFGDHGHYYPQHSTLAEFNSRNFFAIDMNDGDGGDGDQMYGDEGDDSMYGQQGDDRMFGNDDDDDMAGGHNVPGGMDEITTGQITATLNPPVNDLMDGGAGNDAMAGDNAIIWRRGDEITPDDLSPRFRKLTADAIYTTTFETIETNIDHSADDTSWQSDPADADGRDITLIDHSDAVQAMPADPRPFGADVMAGGADSDVMFGELADDLMQGDGAIEGEAVGDPFLHRVLTVTDSGSPDTGETLYFNIPELSTDADDYMEGNGGSDLMYGGLGQDDMIGGSSSLFGLRYETDPESENFVLDPEGEYLRPDTTDYIFGGAGISLGRNDIGATTFGLSEEDPDTHVITTLKGGHVRDADYIMGDNANVYRLVADGSDDFLTFNYDNYESDNDPDTYDRIIPRAMEQLDYTLGGADYNEGTYVDGAAELTGQPADNGAADWIHGESGDDIIFGMTGSDVMFGEGQDDDIIGGYGNDWISGGTGQDGVLGDDGLICTSRNSTEGEPLYDVDGLLDNDPHPKYSDGYVLNEVIKTPGEIQYAVINQEGELKKTADLVPFSYDPNWMAMDDEYPDDQTNTPYADDIIFGGLGSDWLHGASGDDAISGAEALVNAFVPVYDQEGNPIDVLNLGYDSASDPANLHNMNPGDVLAFNSVDEDGWQTNNRKRAGEFDLYDEYSPRHAILLNDDGTLWDPETENAPTNEFLLNFEELEGVLRPEGIVPKATGQQTESYPDVYDDGRDAIFGDLGNDWLVGGTGADNIYGGWGNDLLNADDDHDGHDDENILNDAPDTHPYYQDRAYGGAGRDILIGNTGGDRLIDWVGEYNSYLVPYAPFGMASVSRTMQPFLPEFLYALSAGDGADPTRYADFQGGTPPEPTKNDPIPSRNGEPAGELGLVLQKDFAWQAQTGAPADPQAGNIPGGYRDVLRSANFNETTATSEAMGFFADSGTWSIENGRYQVSPETKGGDALSVFYVDQYIPNYFEIVATINADKPTGGYNSNAYLVFDYQSSEDFKFAGINVSTNKLEIGYRDDYGWHVVVQEPYTTSLKPNTDYNVFLALNGSNATLIVNNRATLSYTFEPRVDEYGITYGLKEGMVGLGANNSSARIDNVIVQRVPPQTTFSHTEDFSSDLTGFFEESLVGDWTLAGGRYEGDAAGTTAINLTSVNVGSAYIIDLSANLNTTDEGGFVYDQYAADDFKFVTISDGRITLGHRTAKGWFVDMVYSSNSVDTGEDYSLRLNLRGTTVSVLLDDQMVLSKTYNAVVTDGNFGLFSMSGVTSFDTVTFKTDDPAFDNVKFLRAAEQGSGEGVTLTDDALAPIVDEAIARWSSTLESDQIGLLEDATVIVADLPDDILGETVGSTILIDADAAGNGWYIDPTPADDVEFADGGSPEGVDLLTVVMHELGHVLGYEDLPDEGSLMTDTLANGVRYVTTPDTLTSLAGSGWVFDIDIESMTYGDRMAAMQQRLNAAIQSSEGSRSARKLVSLAARNEIEDLSDASMKTDNDWLFDFLINGGEKSDPNSGIAIVL